MHVVDCVLTWLLSFCILRVSLAACCSSFRSVHKATSWTTTTENTSPKTWLEQILNTPDTAAPSALLCSLFSPPEYKPSFSPPRCGSWPSDTCSLRSFFSYKVRVEASLSKRHKYDLFITKMSSVQFLTVLVVVYLSQSTIFFIGDKDRRQTDCTISFLTV